MLDVGSGLAFAAGRRAAFDGVAAANRARRLRLGILTSPILLLIFMLIMLMLMLLVMPLIMHFMIVVLLFTIIVGLFVGTAQEISLEPSSLYKSGWFTIMVQ